MSVPILQAISNSPQLKIRVKICCHVWKPSVCYIKFIKINVKEKTEFDSTVVIFHNWCNSDYHSMHLDVYILQMITAQWSRRWDEAEIVDLQVTYHILYFILFTFQNLTSRVFFLKSSHKLLKSSFML